MQLIAQYIILEKRHSRRSQVTIFFATSLKKYIANLFILLLLLSEMISAYTLHKSLKPFPPHVYCVTLLSLSDSTSFSCCYFFPGKVAVPEGAIDAAALRPFRK